MIYINDMPRAYRQGMTLEQALKENGFETRSNYFNIYVNDEMVDPEDYSSFVLNDEDDVSQMFPFFVD